MLSQAEWREEVKKHFEKIKSEGTCIHRLDEELIRRRREELRSADLSPTSPLAQVLISSGAVFANHHLTSHTPFTVPFILILFKICPEI